MKEKQVQIPNLLFCELMRYFLLDQRDAETEATIIKSLNNKLEAITRHELYSKYKTAPTPEAQEQARKDYLERIHAPQDFRY